MFIRSNTLTAQDIRDSMQHARNEGYDIMLDTFEAISDEGGIRSFKPRKFNRGFQFYCEAIDGKYARNFRPGRAASWDAYGVAMAYLYKLDPQAEIAWYKSARHFLDMTNRDSSRVHAPGEAPWLADGKLWAVAHELRRP